VSYACPRCGRTSHHPLDEIEGYCGACHDWTMPTEYEHASLYYDRAGRRMAGSEWMALIETDYQRVALTEVGDVQVSTVWLGLDHNFGLHGPPLIFETLVFGGTHDGDGERYATEAAALGGHDQWVAAVRAHAHGPPGAL
jgi:hypothetical protein